MGCPGPGVPEVASEVTGVETLERFVVRELSFLPEVETLDVEDFGLRRCKSEVSESFLLSAAPLCASSIGKAPDAIDK